uniref:Olfactory marker protein a n=1 Tax=Astyanax mexicanus TaxID=7994 RepID=A0A8B9RG98_ASTMX
SFTGSKTQPEIDATTTMLNRCSRKQLVTITNYFFKVTCPTLTIIQCNLLLQGLGRLSVTGISQLWTPDLTNLMTRQLLEPTGQFWRSAGDPEDAPLKCLEADIQEFGERIAELAKVRKVMYFLFAFKDGAEKDNIKCSLMFKKNEA